MQPLTLQQATRELGAIYSELISIAELRPHDDGHRYIVYETLDTIAGLINNLAPANGWQLHHCTCGECGS